jgi:acyl dehydratase
MGQGEYVYFEDMLPGRVRRSASLPPLTREAVIAFAQAYDPQPQHLGEDSAAQSNLGVFCASGWHTGCPTMRLIAETAPIKGGGMGAGIEIRWPRPVWSATRCAWRSRSWPRGRRSRGQTRGL